MSIPFLSLLLLHAANERAEKPKAKAEFRGNDRANAAICKCTVQTSLAQPRGHWSLDPDLKQPMQQCVAASLALFFSPLLDRYKVQTAVSAARPSPIQPSSAQSGFPSLVSRSSHALRSLLPYPNVDNGGGPGQAVARNCDGPHTSAAHSE